MGDWCVTAGSFSHRLPQIPHCSPLPAFRAAPWSAGVKAALQSLGLCSGSSGPAPWDNDAPNSFGKGGSVSSPMRIQGQGRRTPHPWAWHPEMLWGPLLQSRRGETPSLPLGMPCKPARSDSHQENIGLTALLPRFLQKQGITQCRNIHRGHWPPHPWNTSPKHIKKPSVFHPLPLIIFFKFFF